MAIAELSKSLRKWERKGGELQCYKTISSFSDVYFLEEEEETQSLFSFILQYSLIVHAGTAYMVVCDDDTTSHAVKW